MEEDNSPKVRAGAEGAPHVRVILQLLQHRNKALLLTVPLWSPTRGDEAICCSELRLGLLAQSCLAPGFSTLLANCFATYSFDPAVRS